jgi:hypothetical protein
MTETVDGYKRTAALSADFLPALRLMLRDVFQGKLLEAFAAEADLVCFAESFIFAPALF